MLRRRLALPACLLALILLAPGCAAKKEKEATERFNDQVPVAWKVRSTGAVEIDFDEKVTSLFVQQGGNTPILGVRPADAVRYEKVLFSLGMSVVPYRGNGRYLVARTPEGSPPGGGGAQSHVGLDWWSEGVLNDSPIRFERHDVECRVDVKKDGLAGKINCPKLSTATGDLTIALNIEWKAPEIPTTTTTEPVDSTSSTDPSTSSSTSTP